MRLRLGIAVLALACGVLAACTNSTTGGSTLPGGQLQPLQNPITPSPVPTHTPDFATGNVIVAGDGKAIELNAPGDFKVTAVFPKSTASPMPSPITLSATVSVPGPPGIPQYGPKTRRGFLFVQHHAKSPALIYVWFESDKGVTMSALPTLDFSVPLSALEPYGTDPTLHLDVYDPANESKWTSGIARRTSVTPAPSPSGSVSAAATVTATPTATPTPTPTPTPTLTVTPIPRPGQPFGATPPVLTTPTPVGFRPTGPMTPRPTVPTTEMRFVPAQRAMKLLPKKPLVFVLYAEAASTAAPSATAKSSAKPSPSSAASAAASPSPSAASSASAAPSSSASASPAPSPSST
jgi:hypothetical protein